MMRISNISEREIRRFIQGYTDMNRDYDLLIDVVNKGYRGRFVDLIFALIDGESEDFRKVDDSILTLDNIDRGKAEFILNLKNKLDRGTPHKTTCVFVSNSISDRILDLSYLSEFENILETYCGELKEIDVYCVLRRIIDVFIFDFIDAIRQVDEEDVDGSTFIYMIKNHDDLELVLC